MLFDRFVGTSIDLALNEFDKLYDHSNTFLKQKQSTIRFNPEVTLQEIDTTIAILNYNDDPDLIPLKLISNQLNEVNILCNNSPFVPARYKEEIVQRKRNHTAIADRRRKCRKDLSKTSSVWHACEDLMYKLESYFYNQFKVQFQEAIQQDPNNDAGSVNKLVEVCLYVHVMN